MNVVITHASENDAIFIKGHEGTVLRAYRCPAGVITIGCGFTMASKVFAAWCMKKWGRGLQMGDTITEQEVDMLLPAIIDEEYGAAVARVIKPKKQHHYGSATSMTFNCGKGALKWRWARALAAGKVTDAANFLRVTATTANGRKLRGLVRRRQEEAHLMETGDYGIEFITTHRPSISSTIPAVMEYQTQLKKLGYYKGEVDGKRGPLTKSAIERFQQENDLTVDGIVGPATRAALIRALDKSLTNKGAVGSGAAAGAGGGANDAATSSIDWGTLASVGITAILVVVVVFVGFQIWRNRGRIFGTGRVPT